MKYKIVAGLFALGFSTTLLAIPAEARCEDGNACRPLHTTKTAAVIHHHAVRHYAFHRAAPASTAGQQSVVSLIQSMAPSHGVPTWFALRIAKVESNYNTNARGTHGELGVFQMKCETARGIGYHGACAGLLNARTGVEFGLRHLALAIRSSGGNLAMAASKHNGGLGTRHLVPKYVAQVF